MIGKLINTDWELEMRTDFFEYTTKYEKAKLVTLRVLGISTTQIDQSTDTVLVYSDEDIVRIDVDVQKMKDKEIRRKIQAMLSG